MRSLLLSGLLLLLPIASPAGAQSPSAEVEAAVVALFDAMRAGDGAAAADLFLPEARLQTAVPEGDSTRIRSTPIERFVEAIGGEREAVWDERIWDPVIQVDGPLATAWTPYAFYRGTELSHCGVNAFQFVRSMGAWKILQIIDTRTPADECAVPETVREKRGE